MLLIFLLFNSFSGKDQIHKQRQHPDLSPDYSSSSGGVADKDSVSWFSLFCLSTFTVGYEFMLSLLWHS
jgi:hypothetical protein